MTLCIAITGNIGSGKSSVTRAFAAEGIPTLSADEIAHALLESGTPTHAEVVMRFGNEYVAEDGSIDRRKLGKLVFTDEAAKNDLEQILHPAIRQSFKEQLEQLSNGGAQIVIYEVPLYFEVGGSIEGVSKVLTVYADPETCIQRVMARNNLSYEDAKERYDSQMDINEKVAKSDYVIENTGTLQEVTAKVKSLLCDINRERNDLKP